MGPKTSGLGLRRGDVNSIALDDDRPAGLDEEAFEHVGDGIRALQRARADHAKRPATGYGARPSWAIIPSWSL